MRKSSLGILLALAIGAAFGWAASSGKWTFSQAEASTDLPASAATDTPVAEHPCCAGDNRLAALATTMPISTRVQPDTGTQQPNILVIMADDVGWMNVSCYGGDILGVSTPNIDRIAK